MKEEEQAAVVCVRKSAWERVTETEELVGRLSFGSRFPQYLVLSILFEVWGKGGVIYLTTAMLTGAVVLAWYISAIVRSMTVCVVI